MKKQFLLALIVTVGMISGCTSMQMTRPEEKAIIEKEVQEKETPEEKVPEETKQTPPTQENKEETQSESKETAPQSEEETKVETEEKEASEQQKEEDAQEEKKETSETSKEPVKNTPVEIVNQFTNQEEYDLELDITTLSREPQSWGFKRNKEHQPVKGYYNVDLAKYGTYYLGDTSQKVVYLTFDEGYENGYTPTILDTLKEKGVKAAFFITGSYLKHNPDLVKRMKDEGHLIANHSQTHPDFTTKSLEEVLSEVNQVGDKYKELTGSELDPFFRFPSGRYTERDLYAIRKLGYRNVFWSIAHKDWDVNNQPGKEAAYQHVMDNYHNGAVILLHAVSSSNTEALADIITGLDEAGYRFGSLYELE